MSLERTLNIKNINNRYPIIQGGMGIGVSLEPLCTAVGKEGGIGTISSVALDQFTRKRLIKEGQEVKDETPFRMNYIEAVEKEVYDTKEKSGVAAINIMCKLPLFYEKAIEGAIKGGVDMIVSGAGMPIKSQNDNSVNLPYLVRKYAGENHKIALVPIVSSSMIANKVCKSWEKEGYIPDAIILEGPKAGGHLGWAYKRIERSENFLEEYDLFNNLLDPVLKIAERFENESGPIPIIVAGGIYTHEDISYALNRGAAAVQMGSRFAATKESGFTDESKQLIINAKKEDIIIAKESWGSPCEFPFRYIEQSGATENKKGNYFCICAELNAGAGINNSDKKGTKGFPSGCPERYVLLDEKTPCPAIGTAVYKGLVTIGSEGYRINKELTVKELMTELIN